jgi:hypothetical protein
MAGVTKLFATTIDIRDMTKWKAERRHACPEAIDFRCGRSCAQLSAIKMHGCLMSYHRIDDLGHAANESHALAELFRGELDTSMSKPCRHYCQKGHARAPKRAQQIMFS